MSVAQHARAQVFLEGRKLIWFSISLRDTFHFYGTAWCSEIGSLTSLDALGVMHQVMSENQFHCTKLYMVCLSALVVELAICEISKENEKYEIVLK